MKFKDTAVWKIIKNKYVITCVVFALIILFLDENNLFVVRSLRKDVTKLQMAKDTMREGIRRDSIRVVNMNNIDTMVTIAREEYYMKRADEDVFLINRD